MEHHLKVNRQYTTINAIFWLHYIFTGVVRRSGVYFNLPYFLSLMTRHPNFTMSLFRSSLTKFEQHHKLENNILLTHLSQFNIHKYTVKHCVN
jgi:hypothetical protein